MEPDQAHSSGIRFEEWAFSSVACLRFYLCGILAVLLRLDDFGVGCFVCFGCAPSIVTPHPVLVEPLFLLPRFNILLLEFDDLLLDLDRDGLLRSNGPCRSGRA